MIESHKPLLLDPNDFMTKYGFGDGDIGGYFVDAWASTAWPKGEEYDYFEDDIDPAVSAYLSGRYLLIQAVQRFLLPSLSLPAQAEIIRVQTAHNPLRVVDIGDDWPSKETSDHLESCQAVQVPAETLDLLCEELFPQRPQSWLELYAALTWEFKLLEELTGNLRVFQNEVNQVLAPFIDDAAAQVGVEGLRLCAELVESRRTAGQRAAFTLTDFREILAGVNLLLT